MTFGASDWPSGRPDPDIPGANQASGCEALAKLPEAACPVLLVVAIKPVAAAQLFLPVLKGHDLDTERQLIAGRRVLASCQHDLSERAQRQRLPVGCLLALVALLPRNDVGAYDIDLERVAILVGFKIEWLQLERCEHAFGLIVCLGDVDGLDDIARDLHLQVNIGEPRIRAALAPALVFASVSNTSDVDVAAEIEQAAQVRVYLVLIPGLVFIATAFGYPFGVGVDDD